MFRCKQSQVSALKMLQNNCLLTLAQAPIVERVQDPRCQANGPESTLETMCSVSGRKTALQLLSNDLLQMTQHIVRSFRSDALYVWKDKLWQQGDTGEEVRRRNSGILERTSPTPTCETHLNFSFVLCRMDSKINIPCFMLKFLASPDVGSCAIQMF